jgi:hypothetical protein
MMVSVDPGLPVLNGQLSGRCGHIIVHDVTFSPQNQGTRVARGSGYVDAAHRDEHCPRAHTSRHDFVSHASHCGLR